jgi:hypothetical protein
MGGLDLETDEDENVRNNCSAYYPPALLNERKRQGIDGPIVLTGFAPELDDFTIRVVDGRSLPFSSATHVLNRVCRPE